MGSFTYAICERNMTADQAAGEIFLDSSDRRIPLFKEMNFEGRPSLRTGFPVLIPTKTDFDPKLKEKAQGLGNSLQRGHQFISGRAAKFMNDNAGTFDLIENLDKSAVVQGTGKVMGHLEKRLDLITRDLKKLDALYKSELAQGLKTNTQAFYQKRLPLEKALNDQLTGFARKHILHDHTQTNMRKALGIKHGATHKAFQIGHEKIKIGGLSQSISASKGLANFMKTASTPLAAIQVGSLGIDVMRTTQSDGYVAGGRKAAGNTGKFLGGKAGAKAGAAGAMLAFGVLTGGAGFGVLGIAALAGGAIGGGMLGAKAGEWAGNNAFDGYHEIAKLGGEVVSDWITRL